MRRFPTWTAHLLAGSLAFVGFEILLWLVLDFLGQLRNPAYLIFDLLLFLSCASILALVSSLRLVSAQARQDPSNRPNDQPVYIEPLPESQSELLRQLTTRAQDSLSAIMFYARARSQSPSGPQDLADLREVMERVEQVHLLLERMTQLASGTSFENIPDAPDWIPFQAPPSKPPHCLRKTGRKTVILPVKVQYFNGDASREFQTYTINLSAEGACLIFSSSPIDLGASIRVEMEGQLEAEAHICWIQAKQDRSFRLAGIQFKSAQSQMEKNFFF
ncbi:MAG: PilZ domain-containing protein [Acidobacteriota bacterium]